MKKISLLFVLMTFIYSAHAQIGIQAGASFYSGKATVDNVSLKYDIKAGFTAGIVYSMPLGKSNFSFMPSLNFTQKGGKFNQTGIEDNLTLNYIDLPLNFVYNVDGFFIGAGPVLGFGVGGKDKSTFDGQSETNDVKFGNSEDDDLKPFEFGANIIGGYKFSKGFFISANFNPGINNIAPDNPDETKFHNSGFAVRIGYFFGGMKKTSSSAKM